MSLALHSSIASARAQGVVPDGSDGAFHPVGYPTLNMNNLVPDGVFNFTTIHIPPGLIVSFTSNTSNTRCFWRLRETS